MKCYKIGIIYCFRDWEDYIWGGFRREFRFWIFFLVYYIGKCKGFDKKDVGKRF